MAKSNEILKQIRANLDQYVEEQKKQNEKRAEKQQLQSSIDALRADIAELRNKAKQMTVADEAARNDAVRPLIELLGLKVEYRHGREYSTETHRDRDGEYDVSVTKYRAYAMLVDRYGHQVYEARILDKYYAGNRSDDKKKDINAAKNAIKQSGYDANSLLADFFNKNANALDILKEAYTSPEKWDLAKVEAEIKSSVRDIGLDAVKEALKELKKQRPALVKEYNAAKKEYDFGSHYYRSELKYKLDSRQEKLNELDSKIKTHERAIELYGIKADLIKLVAKVNADIEKRGTLAVIESAVPAQEKYVAVKLEADETVKAEKAIYSQISEIERQESNLEYTISKEDKQVERSVFEGEKINEEVDKIINEDFIKSGDYETLRRDCYVLLSTAKLDELDQKITSTVFDKLEAMLEKDTEREDA